MLPSGGTVCLNHDPVIRVMLRSRIMIVCAILSAGQFSFMGSIELILLLVHRMHCLS